jgi:hypothetical protein
MHPYYDFPHQPQKPQPAQEPIPSLHQNQKEERSINTHVNYFFKAFPVVAVSKVRSEMRGKGEMNAESDWEYKYTYYVLKSPFSLGISLTTTRQRTNPVPASKTMKRKG